ncbi:amidohydrolase [Hyphococcus sp.]|uniref:amidohydrolase n=1 Tax=Hyphococcus sp. TaxID=2038636 RepID=UPI00208134F1|nr:MAG: amidohydrolase [Marinicaulis sp.]
MFRTPALLTAFCTLIFTACSKDASEQTPPASPVTVFTGGEIYTGVDGAAAADAVAVADGVILAVGSRELVEAGAGENPNIVNLNGAVMYPGFTDAHAHLLGIGMRELTLNLEGTPSVAALVATVAENIPQTREGDVLFGRGWIETGWPERRMPNRDDLDAVSEGRLVILGRADGHAMVVNSAALEAAGIDDSTADPSGGKIERDAAGRASGILIDNAMDLVRPLIGKPSPEKKREAYAKASDVYAAYGWTGMHGMSADPADTELTENLSDEGAIKIRVYSSVDKSGIDALAASGPRKNKNGRVITRSIKAYMDGALGSRGAALSEPYSDRPDTSGLLLMNHEEAMALFEKAITAGLQVNTHAIGDRGNKLLLDWYEETFAAHPDKTDLRWRDEHTQILHTEDIPRYAELGVIPSMQPSHAIGDLFFAPDRLGPDRLDGAYAWRALIDSGSIIAGGSDAPVERGDPMIEFYAAVARKSLDGYSNEDWRPEQAVTRQEALKMFTIWPAYASFQENELGTIEPGKRADFTVLTNDIMTIPEGEILTTKAVMTVVDGDIIFRAE